MIRIMTVFAAMLILAGCVSTQPNYSYTAAAADPTLIFRSDFDFHTWFEVNTDPAGTNPCQNFKRVGYTLMVSSPLIIGTKVTPEVRVQVPAGRPVGVKAHYSFSAGGTESCGPIYASFTPESGKTYQVRMAKGGERCTVFITDTAKPNVLVKATGLQGCK